MGQRQQARFKSVLPVRIWWVGADGTRYSHLTHTLDINQNGARLGGVRDPIAMGDILTLQYKQRRADFRVAWVGKLGSPTQHQIGLVAVEPDKSIWGELPAEVYSDTYLTPEERAAAKSGAQAPATAAKAAPATAAAKVAPPTSAPTPAAAPATAPKAAPVPATPVTAAPAPAPAPAAPVTAAPEPASAPASPAPAPAAPQPAAKATPAITASAGPHTVTRDTVKNEITRRLRFATEELCEIDELIKAGDVDPTVLNEFREALALARHTSWGVQQWFELQQREGQQFPLLSFLIEERLVVATRLCQQLARDVAELSVSVEPESMEALIAAVGELAEKLSSLQLRPGAGAGKPAADAEQSLKETVAEIEKPEPTAADAALGALVQQALTSTGADGVAIALAEGTEMVCHASAGIAPEPGVRWDSASGLSGEALRTGETVTCEDTETDTRVDPVLCRAANLRSCLIIPILANGAPKGTFEAYSSRPSAFSPEHVNTLTEAAGSVIALVGGESLSESM